MYSTIIDGELKKFKTVIRARQALKKAGYRWKARENENLSYYKRPEEVSWVCLAKITKRPKRTSY